MIRLRCAKCNKSVDKVEWYDDPCTGVRHIAAYCHGERDTMTIDPMVLSPAQIEEMKQQEGVAFATQVIGNGNV